MIDVLDSHGHMDPRRGSCSCGQLSLETVGDSIRISVCHCLECQRRTGSPFGAQARFSKSHVRLQGDSSRFTRTGDSGQFITFHFCAKCGSTVYWELADDPDIVVVAVGAFADPTFWPPRFSVYESRQHPWIHIAEPVQREG
jgi:hypothetical protein